MNNALTVSGLTKTYKDFVLDNVSFSVPSGSIVGLIGENGAGKSTTINAALGLIHKEAGHVSILGKDELDNETKEQIGVVFDGSNYPEILSPKKINQIMKNIYGSWDEQAYFRLLKQFSLPLDKQIKQFSKGMKMKYSLALALSHNAELLIMDEPTSGLDPLVRGQLLKILTEYMENGGKGVFFSTHITSDLDKIADMLIMIDNGRIVFREEKDTLLDTYRIVKGDSGALTTDARKLFLSISETDFGFTGITKQISEVRSYIPNIMVERPTIEDIMLGNIGGEK